MSDLPNDGRAMDGARTGIPASPGAGEPVPDVGGAGGGQDRERETTPEGPIRAEFETLCTVIDIILSSPVLEVHILHGLTPAGEVAMERYAAMRMWQL